MQVCVSVMRASTIDRDWKLTKRTAREREKDRESERERERVVREEKDVHASSPFPSYSARTPALLSVSHKFFHMMTRFAVSSNPPDCRWMTSLAAATRFFVTYKNVYLKHTHRQTHTLQCLWFYDLLCTCARARVCVLILHGVPLLLCCLLHSTGTPTLSRYIVDIRPLTSLILSFTTSLVRRGVALKPAGSGCVVLRKCATELGESHYSDFLAQIPPPRLSGLPPSLPCTPCFLLVLPPPSRECSGKITINDDTRHFFRMWEQLKGMFSWLIFRSH